MVTFCILGGVGKVLICFICFIYYAWSAMLYMLCFISLFYLICFICYALSAMLYLLCFIRYALSAMLHQLCILREKIHCILFAAIVTPFVSSYHFYLHKRRAIFSDFTIENASGYLESGILLTNIVYLMKHATKLNL